METVNCQSKILSKFYILASDSALSNYCFFFLNFRAIMKMLLNLMESQNFTVLIVALHTLGRIVRSAEMKSCWSNFLELILLKIIDCYKISKEVHLI